jgi:hypothetical protein
MSPKNKCKSEESSGDESDVPKVVKIKKRPSSSFKTAKDKFSSFGRIIKLKRFCALCEPKTFRKEEEVW